MAIQNRRGNFVDFDPYKMLSGEFAYTLDTEELYYCISPGNVKRCATKEDVIEILETSQDAYNGLQQLLTELEDETVATGILNDISDLVIKSNKNENDIMKLDNRQIGSNLAISTSQFVKNMNFTSNKVYLSPTALGTLKSGDTITLSAYLSNINIDSLALEIEFNDADDAQVGAFTGDFVSINGLYTFTTTIPANAVGGDIYAVQPYSSAVSNAFGIQDLKLELGSVVTPWKPSIYALANLQRDLGSLTTDFNTHKADYVQLENQVTELNGNLIKIENKIYGMELIRFSKPGNQNATIRATGHHVYMLFIQGSSGLAYGAYVLQGYEPGTSVRNHATKLGAGSVVEVQIQNMDYVISVDTANTTNYRLLVLMGTAPIML